MTVLAGVLKAHQGGWDEALFVGVPIVLLWGLLSVLNRRSRGEDAEQDVE